MNDIKISAYATIRYGRSGALIYGEFDNPPEDAFFAKISERLPYIDENGNKRFYDNSFYVFCGKELVKYNGETYFSSKSIIEHQREIHACEVKLKEVVSVDLLLPWIGVAGSKDKILETREEFNLYIRDYYERFLDIVDSYDEVNRKVLK